MLVTLSHEIFIKEICSKSMKFVNRLTLKDLLLIMVIILKTLSFKVVFAFLYVRIFLNYYHVTCSKWLPIFNKKIPMYCPLNLSRKYFLCAHVHVIIFCDFFFRKLLIRDVIIYRKGKRSNYFPVMEHCYW